MLTLTRRKGDAIQIGNEITVVVRKLRGRAVQISIDAPQHFRIKRTDRLGVQHHEESVNKDT
jgi:carbon storage regulator CsrA